MKRTTWEFPYSTGRVAEVAKARRDFHQSRVAWWREQFEATKKKIKEEGLDFDESLAEPGRFSDAANMRYTTSNAGRQATVQIDQELLRDLQESQMKIATHTRLTDEYDGWLSILSAQIADVTLMLNHDDWLFFFKPIPKEMAVAERETDTSGD